MVSRPVPTTAKVNEVPLNDKVPILLNAGNLWIDGYLDEVIRLNEEFKDTVQVKALFGSISGLTPTARSADRIPFRDPAFVEGYVLKAQEHGIAIRYTLNQSCIGSLQDFLEYWFTHLRKTVAELCKMGIREWTVTSPLLVELLKQAHPELFVEVSTIAEVSTAEDAERWKKLGAGGVNISTSINRDPIAIKRIVGTGITVSILANEACLFRCPWRRECYNLSSHNSSRSEELFGFYPFRRCTEMRLKDPVEWIKSRLVLPQWMKIYRELFDVNWFKIAYRTHPMGVALPMLRAYMEQMFSGNLLELWPTITHLGKTVEPKDTTYISAAYLDVIGFLQDCFSNDYRCSHLTCDVCGFCRKTYERVLASK